MAVYTSLYDGQDVDASVGRSYVPTLNAAPTSSTLTFLLNGNTVSFEIGQFAKVAVTGGYNFYQMANLSSGVATWEKVDYGGDKEDKMGVIAVVDTVDATLPVSSLTCETDKYYRLDVPVETLAVTLPEMSNVTVVKTVVLYLTGGTTPAVTISSTAPSGGTAPAVHFSDGYAIESGNTYEVNCAWNGLAWIIASFKINISNS